MTAAIRPMPDTDGERGMFGTPTNRTQIILSPASIWMILLEKQTKSKRRDTVDVNTQQRHQARGLSSPVWGGSTHVEFVVAWVNCNLQFDSVFKSGVIITVANHHYLTERIYMSATPVNYRFDGRQFCRMWRQTYKHLILTTDVNMVQSLPVLLFRQISLFVSTGILINQMCSLCANMCVMTKLVCVFVCCEHAVQITTFDSWN